MKKNLYKNTISFIVVGVFGLCILFVFFRPRNQVYLSIESPDRQHKVVVTKNAEWFIFPGGSSDMAGTVYLKNSQNKVIHKIPIDIVQQVEKVYWTTNSVHIKGVVDWKLE